MSEQYGIDFNINSQQATTNLDKLEAALNAIAKSMTALVNISSNMEKSMAGMADKMAESLSKALGTMKQVNAEAEKLAKQKPPAVPKMDRDVLDRARSAVRGTFSDIGVPRNAVQGAIRKLELNPQMLNSLPAGFQQKLDASRQTLDEIFARMSRNKAAFDKSFDKSPDALLKLMGNLYEVDEKLIKAKKDALALVRAIDAIKSKPPPPITIQMRLDNQNFKDSLNRAVADAKAAVNRAVTEAQKTQAQNVLNQVRTVGYRQEAQRNAGGNPVTQQYGQQQATAQLDRLRQRAQNIAPIEARINVRGGESITEALQGVRSLSGAVGALGRMFPPLAAAALIFDMISAAIGQVIQAMQQLGQEYDKYVNMQGRLKIVTKGQDELNYAMRDAFAIANEVGISVAGVASIYYDFGKAAQQTGNDLNQVGQIVGTIQKAFIVGGTGPQAMEGSLIQLGQGLSEGILRGQEFRSVMQQMGPAGLELAKVFGTTTGGLRKMASDGLLTSKALIEAFILIGPRIEEMFAKMPLTFARVTAKLENSWLSFIGIITEQGGIFQPILKSVDDFANKVNTAFASVMSGKASIKEAVAVSFETNAFDGLLEIFDQLVVMAKLFGQDLIQSLKMILPVVVTLVNALAGLLAIINAIKTTAVYITGLAMAGKKLMSGDAVGAAKDITSLNKTTAQNFKDIKYGITGERLDPKDYSQGELAPKEDDITTVTKKFERAQATVDAQLKLIKTSGGDVMQPLQDSYATATRAVQEFSTVMAREKAKENDIIEQAKKDAREKTLKEVDKEGKPTGKIITDEAEAEAMARRVLANREQADAKSMQDLLQKQAEAEKNITDEVKHRVEVTRQLEDVQQSIIDKQKSLANAQLAKTRLVEDLTTQARDLALVFENIKRSVADINRAFSDASASAYGTAAGNYAAIGDMGSAKREADNAVVEMKAKKGGMSGSDISTWAGLAKSTGISGPSGSDISTALQNDLKRAKDDRDRALAEQQRALADARQKEQRLQQDAPTQLADAGDAITKIQKDIQRTMQDYATLSAEARKAGITAGTSFAEGFNSGVVNQIVPDVVPGMDKTNEQQVQSYSKQTQIDMQKQEEANRIITDRSKDYYKQPDNNSADDTDNYNGGASNDKEWEDSQKESVQKDNTSTDTLSNILTALKESVSYCAGKFIEAGDLLFTKAAASAPNPEPTNTETNPSKGQNETTQAAGSFVQNNEMTVNMNNNITKEVDVNDVAEKVAGIIMTKIKAYSPYGK